MEQSVQTYQGAVYPWHCDHMGHMNVMHYVGKFDEATWNFFSIMGLQGKKMRDENKGVVAVEQKTYYKRELLAGDVISIHSHLIEFADKSIKFRHEMRNIETDDIVAITILTGLYFDREQRKTTSLPYEVQQKLQMLVE